MQLHSALTVAERLKLERAVVPMGARTLWHNPLYYNRTLTRDALLAVLGWRLPSTSTRTHGFLGDEEVNDLILAFQSQLCAGAWVLERVCTFHPPSSKMSTPMARVATWL